MYMGDAVTYLSSAPSDRQAGQQCCRKPCNHNREELEDRVEPGAFDHQTGPAAEPHRAHTAPTTNSVPRRGRVGPVWKPTSRKVPGPAGGRLHVLKHDQRAAARGSIN